MAGPLMACARCSHGVGYHNKDGCRLCDCKKWRGGRCRKCDTFTFSANGHQCRDCYACEAVRDYMEIEYQFTIDGQLTINGIVYPTNSIADITAIYKKLREFLLLVQQDRARPEK